MRPWFSLVLPCYNVENYVERCVQSILKQDFDDYEIILVDDGSTDRTSMICDALSAEHECIQVIHKTNGGLSSARNAGMEAAQGRYIWFIDSDDWIEEGSLRLLYQACEKDHPDVVKFDYYRVKDKKRRVRCTPKSGTYEEAGIQQLCRMAFCGAGRFGMSVWVHVFRRAMLQERCLRFVPEREVGSEDYLFVLQLFPHVQKLRMLDVPLYAYELRAGSLTQTYKADLAKRYVRLCDLLKIYYDEQGILPQYEALVERFFLWHLLINTCVVAEYDTIYTGRKMRDARRNARKLLNMKETQRACRKADRQGLGLKKYILLLAARLRLELMFYCVFAKKK